MNGILSNAYLQLGIGIFIALIVACLPFKAVALCTTPFSMKTFGIRKIKRWHSRTDTLANCMIWISVILCIGAPWIPYSPWICAVWLTFTYLCALSRAVRLTQAYNDAYKRIVIFFISALYAISLNCALGMNNGFVLWKYFFDYANMIESKAAFDIMLYLNNITPMGYLAQLILLLVPLVSLWGQFKYMRLENTFKGANIFLYVIKTLILLLIVFGLGAYATKGLSAIYNQDQTLTQLVRLPLNKNEIDQITAESMPPAEPQPADPNVPVDPNAQPAPADPNAPVDPNAPAPVDPNVQPGV